MLDSRSLGSRLALVCAGSLLCAGFAWGATPAVAASRPVSVRGSSVSTGVTTSTTGSHWVGAESRVDLSELLQDHPPAEPAVPRKSGLDQNGSAQAASSTANGAYTALPPTRLLDTRTSGETLHPAGSLNLTVTGGSVPATATAVALNVTVTNTTAGSYLSVYPAGGTLPLLSNLNWGPGETVPNLVIVPVGSAGQVTFYNDLGRADLVVDLEGYFAPEPSGTTAGSYVPLTPSRITDTRAGSGEPNAGQTLGPGSTLNVQVTGAGGVPASGVTAALLNVTVTDTTSASYLTVYPQGETQPLASNLNWIGGDTVPNRVVVPVSSTGEISIYNDLGKTDVVVDVDGYFTDGTVTPTTASLFSPISPVRVLDTRQTGQTLGPGATLTEAMAGVDGIASNANAVVTNVTATDTTAPSYFTVYPGGTRPLASDLNWGPGQTVPNLTVATLSGTGAMDIFNDAGRSDLVIDAFGYFAPEAPTPVVVLTSSLPSATVGDSYSTTLTAYGGTPTYSWEVVSGSLPSGLSLSPSGVISGTPTTATTCSFTVEVADSTTPTAETPASASASAVAGNGVSTLSTTSPTLIPVAWQSAGSNSTAVPASGPIATSASSAPSIAWRSNSSRPGRRRRTPRASWTTTMPSAGPSGNWWPRPSCAWARRPDRCARP